MKGSRRVTAAGIGHLHRKHSEQHDEDEESLVLFIVRHGHRADRDGRGSEGVWARSCPPGHEHDPYLSETGLAEGTATGALFARLLAQGAISRIRQVVSSPLSRCVHTASLLLKELPPSAHPNVIEADVGFYEALIENLFANGPPPHLLSPQAPWAAASSSSEESRGKGGKPKHTDISVIHSQRLKEAIAAVGGEEPAVLSKQFPESNTAHRNRSFDALCSYLNDGGARWTASSDREAPEGLVVVTHQCIASALVRSLLERSLSAPHEERDGAAAAANNKDGSGMDDEGQQTKKGKLARDAWKQLAAVLHDQHNAEEAARGVTNGGPGWQWPRQRNLQFQFDTCSVTALKLSRPKGDTTKWSVRSIPLMSCKDHAPPVASEK